MVAHFLKEVVGAFLNEVILKAGFADELVDIVFVEVLNFPFVFAHLFYNSIGNM